MLYTTPLRAGIRPQSLNAVPAFAAAEKTTYAFNNPEMASTKLNNLLGIEFLSFIRPKDVKAPASTASFKAGDGRSYTIANDLENLKKKDGPYQLSIKNNQTLLATIELNGKYHPTKITFESVLCNQEREDWVTWLKRNWMDVKKSYS